jgi:TIR domain-containing protein
MATLYLSYKSEDIEDAKKLKKELKQLGYEVKWDQNVITPGGHFRTMLMDALVGSDAVVSLLTEKALRSPYVLGELGAARAMRQTKGALLLPIAVGSSRIPEVVNDLSVITIPELSDGQLAYAAEKIDWSIKAHLKQRAAAHGSSPRIFISHRHKDAKIVAALVSLVEEAFDVKQEDIRCTSLPPYTLPIGARTADVLRSEIRRAEVVLGVIGPDTTESDYVLAELGAAWGLEVPTFPLLAGGASHQKLPEVLKGLHSVALTDETACAQLVEDLKTRTTLAPRPVSQPRFMREVKALTAAAAGPANP